MSFILTPKLGHANVSKFAKVLAIAISTTSDGEIISAVGRIRAIAKSAGVHASEIIEDAPPTQDHQDLHDRLARLLIEQQALRDEQDAAKDALKDARKQIKALKAERAVHKAELDARDAKIAVQEAEIASLKVGVAAETSRADDAEVELAGLIKDKSASNSDFDSIADDAEAVLGRSWRGAVALALGIEVRVLAAWQAIGEIARHHHDRFIELVASGKLMPASRKAMTIAEQRNLRSAFGAGKSDLEIAQSLTATGQTRTETWVRTQRRKLLLYRQSRSARGRAPMAMAA